MRGCQQAHVHLPRLRAPNSQDLPIRDHAQELGLRGGRHLRHFVEEEGSLVGSLEEPLTAAVGAGKGALFVAKELAFEQRLRKGRTVHRHKGFGGPGAVLMDGASHQFLAGAGFAGDQDRGAGRSDPRDQFAHRLHRRA